MLRRIKNKFRKHKYISTGTTSNGGQKYTCAKCKQKLYIPTSWSYEFTKDHVKKLKGCTVKRGFESNCDIGEGNFKC